MGADECGSRFGCEAVFMFAVTDGKAIRLEWCVGRRTGLSVCLDEGEYGKWFRVELELDWVNKCVSVNIDGERRGTVGFRQDTSRFVEHITLINFGGPAAASWTEIALG